MTTIDLANIEKFESGMKALGLGHEVRWTLEEMCRTQSGEEFLNDVLERRRNHEPLAYIFGHWQFRDLELHVAPGVLIPRPETEELVDYVLEGLRPRSKTFASWNLVDAGAGSGCLGISLVREAKKKFGYDMKLTLIERSLDALPTLLKNVRDFAPSAEVFEGSWMHWVPREKVQVFVSNPPYISGQKADRADPSVEEWEPREALYPDDLHKHTDASGPYRELIKIADLVVERGGIAAFELGPAQASWIETYVKENFPLWIGHLRIDMAGKPRFWIMERV